MWRPRRCTRGQVTLRLIQKWNNGRCKMWSSVWATPLRLCGLSLEEYFLRYWYGENEGVIDGGWWMMVSSLNAFYNKVLLLWQNTGRMAWFEPRKEDRWSDRMVVYGMWVVGREKRMMKLKNGDLKSKVLTSWMRRIFGTSSCNVVWLSNEQWNHHEQLGVYEIVLPCCPCSFP